MAVSVDGRSGGGTPLQLILVRHGQTDFNRDGRVQGKVDRPLDDTGVAQAHGVGEALRSPSLNGIYSSPLRRARETAEAIATHHGVAVQVREALVEMDVGEIDGITYEEMRSGYPELLEAWTRDVGSVRFPGGETVAEMQERAWPVVEEIRAQHDGGRVALVGHAFMLQGLLCTALNLSLKHFRSFRLSPGSLSALLFGPGDTVLEGLNHSSHLDSVAAGG